MSRLPTLSSDQFDRASDALGRILAEGLSGEAAEVRIAAEAGSDSVLADALRQMLSAHESEIAASETDGAFHASAMEVVRDETRRAGERIERHVPEAIGPYRVRRFIASGGMGTVYEAEQDEPRRRVAIKVIRLELLTEASIRRFEDEGHMLARLRHPGIARVYAMGRTDTPAGTVPYLVLEFIDGVPITEYARTNGLDVRARVELICKVADAVQYAHDNGVLHRDLKPGNVLVDKHGQPHVLDFGIGRTFDEERDHASLTASGLFLGTLAYMSPEQAVRRKKPLDVRVDVYGVGAIGYELFAGRAPHVVKDMPLHEAVERVAMRAPAPLDARAREVGADLSAIFGKALATDPDRRYRSVRELRSDLQRYLEHEPVEARPPSHLYQARMLVRRHRTTFLLLTVLFATLVTGLGLALGQRMQALDAKAVATSTAEEATRDRRAAMLSNAWNAVEQGRPLGVFDAAAPFEAETERFVEHELLRAHTWNAVRVEAIEGMPPGSALLANPSGVRATTVARDGVVHLVDLEAARAEPLVPLGGDEPLQAKDVAWSQNQPTWLAVLGADELVVVDSETRRIIHTIDRQTPTVEGVGPDSDLVVWRAKGHDPELVDLRLGRRVLAPELGDGKTLSVLEGHLVVSGTTTRDVRTGDVRTIASRFHTAGRSPDGRYTMLNGHRPLVHDATLGDIWAPDGHQGLSMADYDFSPDGARLAVLYQDGSTQVWDLASRSLERTCWDTRVIAVWRERPHVSFVARGVRFVVGNRLRALVGDRIAEWSLSPPPTRLDHSSTATPYKFVYRIAWHPQGRWLASVSWDGTLVLWDTHTGDEIGRFDVATALGPELHAREKHTVVPICLGWDEEGQRVFLRLARGSYVVLDAWSGAALARGYSGYHQWLGLEGDSAWMVHPETHDAVRVPLEALGDPAPAAKDLPAGVLPAWTRSRARSAESLGSWHRNGQRVVQDLGRRAAAPWEEFQIWELPSGKTWRQRVTGEALAVHLTDEGRRLFVGTRSGDVQVFDVETRRRLMALHGHEDYVIAVARSPDGSMVATASGDGWVRLWPLRPMAERVAQRDASRADDLRLQDAVDRAIRAGADMQARAAALREDSSIADVDRLRAQALLLRRGSEAR